MNKLLILGSNGLLGGVIGPVISRNYPSVALHSRDRKNKYKADLNDSTQTAELIKTVSPDTIINLVALANVEDCEEPQRAYVGNVKVVENIVDAIHQDDRKDCHLIHISTDHVYDALGYKKENDVLLTNYYAFSKYAAELAVQRIDGCSIRTNFFGKSASSHRMSFTDWLQEKLMNDDHIQVFQDVFFNPLSMSTIASMLEKISELKLEGVYNLGARNGMSKADFAFLFAEEMRLPTKNISRTSIEDVDYITTYRPRNMQMDVSKIEGILEEEMPVLHEEISMVAKEYTT